MIGIRCLVNNVPHHIRFHLTPTPSIAGDQRKYSGWCYLVLAAVGVEERKYSELFRTVLLSMCRPHVYSDGNKHQTSCGKTWGGLLPVLWRRFGDTFAQTRKAANPILSSPFTRWVRWGWKMLAKWNQGARLKEVATTTSSTTETPTRRGVAEFNSPHNLSP